MSPGDPVDPADRFTVEPDYEEAVAPDPSIWQEANQPVYQANSAQDILERISGTSERFPGESMTNATEFGNREMLDAAYNQYAQSLQEVERLANADPDYFNKIPEFQAERMQAQMTFDQVTNTWRANPTPKSFFEDALARNLNRPPGGR